MMTMQTVAETPTFVKQAAELFTADEKAALIDFLAANPLAGEEIPRAGGVRKVRFAVRGRGKRDGARVIYCWYSDAAPIYALLVYAKRRKTDLTAEETAAAGASAKAIKAAQRSKQR